MTVYTAPPALLDSTDSVLVDRLAEAWWTTMARREARFGVNPMRLWTDVQPSLRDVLRRDVIDILDELARMVRDSEGDLEGLAIAMIRDPYRRDGACKLCGCDDPHDD